MARFALVLAIVLASASAHADCQEIVPMEGAAPCEPSSLKEPQRMWFEAGIAVTHFVPATSYQAIDAVGGDFRYLAHNGPWHVGFEFAYAELTGTSRAIYESGPLAGSVITTMPMLTGGSVAQTKLVAGRRTEAGPFTLGGELAAGVQVAEYNTVQMPWTQFWTLVEARAQVDLWLAPHVTLGVQAGVDVLDFGHTEAALLVGYHMRKR